MKTTEPLWKLENAAEAVRSGSHCLHNDTQDAAKVVKFIKTAFPKDPANAIGTSIYYGKWAKNKDKWFDSTSPFSGMAVIKLSEIQFTQTLTIQPYQYKSFTVENGVVTFVGYSG